MINLEAGSSPVSPSPVDINPITFVGGGSVQTADGVNQKLESVQSTSAFNQGDVVAVHNMNGQVFVGLISGIVTDAALIFDRPIAIDVQPGAAVMKVVQVQVVSEWTRVALKTVAVGPDTVITAPVPNTTKGLMIVVRNALINVLNMVGVQSGTSYFAPPAVPTTTGQVRGAVQIPVNGLEDSTYQLNINIGNSAVIAIYATDNFIPHISQGAQVANRSVPVVLAADQPTYAPWLSATSSVGINVGLSTVASTLIAGVANRVIYLHGMCISLDAGTAGDLVQLKDSLNGNVIASFLQTTAGPYSMDFNGQPLGLGSGLVAVTNLGTVNMRGVISYSQST